MPHAASRQPPFENRWTSGRKAWRWYRALESLGVDNARMRMSHPSAGQAPHFPDPDIPLGFVQDWLSWHDRRARRNAVIALSAGVLVVVIGVAALIFGPLPAI
ncbi:hypothetical protein [Phenylobacterium montanum]|uniref:Uncharacterized protein n=1 Tax=Phenylobacterium montanum TaxID=2823693 RepID=A0A975FVQ6_9CAUL|nr:hypothetical protein [Caulobacter sp. S6]QUD86164.1 hypothetical protein KCG34_13750 [Caulobacter sp. S6]